MCSNIFLYAWSHRMRLVAIVATRLLSLPPQTLAATPPKGRPTVFPAIGGRQ